MKWWSEVDGGGCLTTCMGAIGCWRTLQHNRLWNNRHFLFRMIRLNRVNDSFFKSGSVTCRGSRCWKNVEIRWGIKQSRWLVTREGIPRFCNLSHGHPYDRANLVTAFESGRQHPWTVVCSSSPSSSRSSSLRVTVTVTLPAVTISLYALSISIEICSLLLIAAPSIIRKPLTMVLYEEKIFTSPTKPLLRCIFTSGPSITRTKEEKYLNISKYILHIFFITEVNRFPFCQFSIL